MKILIIDNYDSFTYNLVYIIREKISDVTVYRNDKISPEDCLKYDGIILSPGPGLPKESGNLPDIIEACAGRIPILGVCLGHQAIAEHLGSTLGNLEEVYHGVQSTICLCENSGLLFTNIPETFQAGRYHSWDVNDKEDKNFHVTALTEEGTIMALENQEKKLFGIQFHPESIMTPDGHIILENFLSICEANKQ